jgi:tRNA-specific 2-thiouridylase
MKVAVLVSGGVDSSVALARLCRQGGHEITAFYLKIWLEDELRHLGQCPWQEDLDYVTATCRQYGVPLEVLSLQTEYHERVVEYALAELRAGRTPSPDIACNELIKFGEFFRHIGPEFERVATGHYAQREERDGLCWLKRAPDPIKDQSYFLVRLSQVQLRRAWFPIGDLHKAQVRELARQWQLPARDRKDSQGICFLGKIPYREFVRYHLGEAPGPIVDLASGRELGRHPGVWFYTIGQRHGLSLGGGPWYVVRRDLATQTLYVTHADALPAQQRDTLIAADVRWIAAPPTRPDLQLKLRHGPSLIPCRLADLGGGRCQVTLATSDPGIAPGQWAIFYDGEYCLGGGVIE